MDKGWVMGNALGAFSAALREGSLWEFKTRSGERGVGHAGRILSPKSPSCAGIPLHRQVEISRNGGKFQQDRPICAGKFNLRCASFSSDESPGRDFTNVENCVQTAFFDSSFVNVGPTLFFLYSAARRGRRRMNSPTPWPVETLHASSQHAVAVSGHFNHNCCHPHPKRFPAQWMATVAPADGRSNCRD